MKIQTGGHSKYLIKVSTHHEEPENKTYLSNQWSFDIKIILK